MDWTPRTMKWWDEIKRSVVAAACFGVLAVCAAGIVVVVAMYRLGRITRDTSDYWSIRFLGVLFITIMVYALVRAYQLAHHPRGDEGFEVLWRKDEDDEK